jgi:hypothetical protein
MSTVPPTSNVNLFIGTFARLCTKKRRSAQKLGRLHGKSSQSWSVVVLHLACHGAYKDVSCAVRTSGLSSDRDFPDSCLTKFHVRPIWVGGPTFSFLNFIDGNDHSFVRPELEAERRRSFMFRVVFAAAWNRRSKSFGGIEQAQQNQDPEQCPHNDEECEPTRHVGLARFVAHAVIRPGQTRVQVDSARCYAQVRRRAELFPHIKKSAQTAAHAYKNRGLAKISQTN